MLKKILNWAAALLGRNKPRAPIPFKFIVSRREAQHQVLSYYITAKDRAEARARLWLYWCARDVETLHAYQQDRNFSVSRTESPRKEFTILDTNILDEKEAHYLGSIINGNIREPLKNEEIERILTEILADHRMGQWFPNQLQPK